MHEAIVALAKEQGYPADTLRTWREYPRGQPSYYDL